MKGLFIIIALASIAVLEAAGCNYIKCFGVAPELLLLGVVYLSLYSSKGKGAVCGIIGGILKMVFFGLNPSVLITYASAGFVIGFYKEMIYRHSRPIRMALVFTAAIYSNLIYGILISSRGLPYYKAVFFICIPSAAYTALLTPVFFRILEAVTPSKEVEYREIIFKKRVFEGRRPQ